MIQAKETNLQAFDQSRIAELEKYVEEAMTLAQVPGMSIAIVEDGRVVYTKGFGVRETGGTDAVTPETYMMIGSITKSMTSLMIATLVDDKRITWDTPLDSLYPGFALSDPELSPKITFYYSLCACVGLERKDYMGWFNSGQLTAEGMLNAMPGFNVVSQLGEQFAYSNEMVAAGGYIAALVDGNSAGDLKQGYLDAMQARVFDPIRMPSTTFSFEQVKASGDFAMPHGYNLQGTYQAFNMDLEKRFLPVLPSGMVWSNADDMARYMVTLLNGGVTPDGQRVVSSDNLAYLWKGYTPLTATASYGLGWVNERFHGFSLISHQGNTSGYSSDIAFIPEAGVGIVILTNARGVNALNQAIHTRFLELALDLPVSNDTAFRNSLAETQKSNTEWAGYFESDFDPALVAPYVGTFSNPILGEINIEMTGGQLIADSGEFRSALSRLEGDDSLYFAASEPPLLTYPLVFEFKMDAQGMPTIVFEAGSETYVFSKK